MVVDKDGNTKLGVARSRHHRDGSKYSYHIFDENGRDISPASLRYQYNDEAEAIGTRELFKIAKEKGYFDQSVPELSEEDLQPIYEGGYEPGEVVRQDGLVDLYGPQKARKVDPQTGEVTYGAAGFDPETGKFQGLVSAQQEAQQTIAAQQRASDVADVELLGGRVTDAMREQGNIRQALGRVEEATRPMQGEFAFSPGATQSLLGAAEARTTPGVDVQRQFIDAPTQYDISAGITGQQFQGLGDLRGGLLGEALSGITEGLTEREREQIEQASRTAGVEAGRVRDIGRVAGEVEDIVRADQARRLQNIQAAQSILGQEGGLQESDYARMMQADLANQQALNQARQAQTAMGLERAQAEAGLGQQAQLAQQQMIQQRAEGQIGRELAAYESDIARAGAQDLQREQIAQQRLAADRAGALQLLGAEQATSADPMMAILGRPSSQAPAAQGMLSAGATLGQQSGPQYLNPEAGLGYISQRAANQATMAAGQAAGQGSMMGGLLGAVGQIGSAALPLMCWVAREVYGVNNPKWKKFREWMLTKADSSFREAYITHGEAYAKYISDKPSIKERIKSFMDSKIA